jgi:hypothetical protein
MYNEKKISQRHSTSLKQLSKAQRCSDKLIGQSKQTKLSEQKKLGCHHELEAQISETCIIPLRKTSYFFLYFEYN